MKKIILALLLTASSTSAMAEWTLLNVTDKHNDYVDSSSLLRTKTVVRMWKMVDFKTIQHTGKLLYSSIKIQIEYDCTSETLQTVSSIVFSENMGKGEAVFFNHTLGKVYPIVQASQGWLEWSAACGKN
jgi:hypothetical protein